MILCRNLVTTTKKYEILGKRYNKVIYQRCCRPCSEKRQCEKCLIKQNACPCLKCSGSNSSNCDNFKWFPKLSDDMKRYIGEFLDVFSIRCMRCISSNINSLVFPSSLKLEDTDWTLFVDYLIDSVNTYHLFYKNEVAYLPEIYNNIKKLVNTNANKKILREDANLNNYTTRVLASIAKFVDE